MNEASTAPAWLLPTIAVGFPLVFAAFWSFVCWLLAVFSGYRSLAQFRPTGAVTHNEQKLPSPYFAMIGPVSYKGRILSVAAGPEGLRLHVLRLFPFHGTVRIPWHKVAEESSGGFRGGSSIRLDGRVRLRVPEETLAAIRDARAPYG